MIESTKLLRSAIPAATVFLVDPAAKADSRFAQELGIVDAAYIRSGWIDFMTEVSARLTMEHAQQLGNAADQKIQDDGLAPEDLTPFLARLRELGLVVSGRIRAQWLLTDRGYCPASTDAHRLVGDLLLAVATVARISGTAAAIAEDSVIEFSRDGRAAAACLLASGRGSRGRPSIEAAIEHRRRRYRARLVPISGVIVGGTSDPWPISPTPPADVVRGNSAEDIVVGRSTLPMHHISELRADANRIQQVVR